MADSKAERYGLMTFTGPAGRSYWDKDGILQTASENGVREEYDPLTGAYLGMLIDPRGRKNKIKFSDDLTKWDESVQLSDDSSIGVPLYLTKGNEVRGSAGAYGTSSTKFRASFFLKFVSTDAANFRIGWHLPFTDISFYNDGRQPSITRQQDTNTVVEAYEQIKTDIYRVELSVDLDSATDYDSFYIKNANDVAFGGFNLWPGNGSYTQHMKTDGSAADISGDIARFTDPSLFDGFDRGSFYVEVKTLKNSNEFNNPILNISDGRILNIRGPQHSQSNRLYTFDGQSITNAPEVDTEKFVSVVVSYGSGTQQIFANGFGSGGSSWSGWSGDELKVGGETWSGYIKTLSFDSNVKTDEDSRRLTARNAQTVIADCPDGGYYDYSDLSTLFIESDASGIPLVDRTPARVGSRVGTILDKSGRGPHLTATSESSRGILQSDGDHYWIEFNPAVIYDFSFAPERSVTLIHAIESNDDRFIVLSSSAGGNGSYAGAFGDDASMPVSSGWSLSSPRLHVDSEYVQAANSAEAGGAVSGVSVVRVLMQVDSAFSTRAFINGYSSDGYSFTGRSYGFAWGTRLSEDDAETVEIDMRTNMPAA